MHSARCRIKVGREDGLQNISVVNHQRAVGKTVGMIVHEVALQQECAILRLADKGIPLGCHLVGILYDLHVPDKDEKKQRREVKGK